MAKEIILSRDPREETEKAFNLMSEDVSAKNNCRKLSRRTTLYSCIQGKIGPRELRKAFKQLGETVSEDEIMAMVR